MLNRHLTSKVHTRGRVVCPWCLGKEKTFTRVADLKLHCVKNHPESKEVAPTFFSGANGFYMARFPRDYRRIVSIGSWDSEEAFCARRLMNKWCQSQPNSDMVLLHWKAGWAEAMEERPPRTKRPIDDEDSSDLGEDPNIELDFPSTSPQNRRIVIPKRKIATPSRQSTEATKSVEATSPSIGTSNIETENMQDIHESTPLEINEDSLDYEEESETKDEQQKGTDEDDLKSKETTLRKQIEEIQKKLKKKEEEKKKLKVEGEREDSLKRRAVEVLRTGAMPLCPPGRREWKEEGALELDLNGKTILWPPKGFTTMTSDQRLLSLEYLTMMMEQEQQQKFPLVSRQQLVDTYNFLVLPGTRKPYQGEDKACRKLRYYNYQLVKEVALGRTKSHEAISILETLEAVQKQQKTTLALTIVNRMDTKKFPLRLDQD